MKNKTVPILVIGFVVVMALGALVAAFPLKSAVKFYRQVTMERIRSAVDVQPSSQTNAVYVGSKVCASCHADIYEVQHHSMHPKMIQDAKADPAVMVADFASLPADASFAKDEVVYTIGSKFKQRYMLRKDTKAADGSAVENYVIGNYEWNTETQVWQPYKAYKDWYHDAWPEDNAQIPTSHTCDGCHFTGFNSRYTRVEPGVNCENCHGPGSAHAADPKEGSIYVATQQDPQRAMEVCLQCHMRNVDKRLENPKVTVKDLYGDARDGPYGYEPGMPLSKYKLQEPFKPGESDSKFYGNGVGKKNRMQGNDYVQSTMYKHGITCMNCHDPHAVDNTAVNPRGAQQCMVCHKFGSPIGPHQYSAVAHSRHEPGPRSPDCIDCHMPKVGQHTGKSPYTVRTHVFRFIYPQESIDYGIPNACNACHDKSLEWTQQKMDEWGMTTWERH
ncbi:MAG: hypothetical protein K9M54_10170 [Kiritimatiellales bacterium]|nr:hypothetical protein [Kiritimatiellales bacterium]MCF7863369.1 hypothetical protein [Kiritimatiellales bacterium]